MVNNNSYGLMPKIVVPIDRVARRAEYITGKDSTLYYLGSFVSNMVGSDTAPDGQEGFIAPFADDTPIYGFVIGFTTKNGSLPIFEDPGRQGTVTNATGDLPAAYTFPASNDEINSVPKLEKAVVLPIKPGDILEVVLWGASTSPVKRGTTTPFGTTGSSANLNVGLDVNATYPFSLLESSADVDLEDSDFITTKVRGNQPTNPYTVYVKPTRAEVSVVVPV